MAPLSKPEQSDSLITDEMVRKALAVYYHGVDPAVTEEDMPEMREALEVVQADIIEAFGARGCRS